MRGLSCRCCRPLQDALDMSSVDKIKSKDQKNALNLKKGLIILCSLVLRCDHNCNWWAFSAICNRCGNKIGISHSLFSMRIYISIG